MADSRRGEEKIKVETGGDFDRETKPKRRRRNDQNGVVGDPLFVVGPDILEKILNFLDAHSVARTIVISQGWYLVATSDRLWSPRVRITKEDLCDHVWNYCFKAAAPEYWRNLDPCWKNTGPPMRRYFHQDGMHTADPDDKIWGGHESNYSIITSYVGDGRIRQHYVRINRWAAMTVSRLEDWSWEMSNGVFCYTSIPDVDKPEGTGPLFPV